MTLTITDAFLATYAAIRSDGGLDATGAIGHAYAPRPSVGTDVAVEVFLVVLTNIEGQTDTEVPITITIAPADPDAEVWQPFYHGALQESRFFVFPLKFIVRPVPADVTVTVTILNESHELALHVMKPAAELVVVGGNGLSTIGGACGAGGGGSSFGTGGSAVLAAGGCAGGST